MAHIMGKLKVDVTINGKDYKAGETAYTQTQFGLEEYFESVKKINPPIEEFKIVETPIIEDLVIEKVEQNETLFEDENIIEEVK